MDGLNNPDKMKALGHDAIEILAEIEFADTVDAVEVVHGRWVEKYHKNPLGDYFRLHCSECGEDKPNAIHTNYCPNCGAKMDGGD
jgi:PHP family Zn ribbon phosphoesterase